MNKCSTCKHWKTHQRELKYTKFYGFCVNPKFKWNVDTGIPIGVHDRDNVTDDYLQYQFECYDYKISDNPIGRYSLVTEENFGCIYHEPAK